MSSHVFCGIHNRAKIFWDYYKSYYSNVIGVSPWGPATCMYVLASQNSLVSCLGRQKQGRWRGIRWLLEPAMLPFTTISCMGLLQATACEHNFLLYSVLVVLFALQSSAFIIMSCVLSLYLKKIGQKRPQNNLYLHIITCKILLKYFIPNCLWDYFFGTVYQIC